MPAVSPGWTRLPAATTPARDVRPHPSVRGPPVAGSVATSIRRASSWSGTQSPVKTTVSAPSRSTRPVARSSTSTASRRPCPCRAATRDVVRSGTRSPRLVIQAKAATVWWRGSSVTMATVDTPA